jgi:hypothetical protein
MPTEVKDFEFPARNQANGFDWSALTDGRVYRLVNGKDFVGKPESCQTLAHAKAKSLGCKARTCREGENVIVKFEPLAKSRRVTKKQTKA